MQMQMKLMWFSSLALLALASPTPGDKCVCLPGQECWPSISEWDTLNQTVGGKLRAIYPLGKPCHDPTFENATCQAITKQYTNSSWRSDQIGIPLAFLKSVDGRCITTSQLGSQRCVE
jgi:hypothetical protein